MPRVSPRNYPLRLGLTYCGRAMGTANTFLTSDDDLVRLHQLEFPVIESGHGTVVRHDGPGKQ